MGPPPPADAATVVLLRDAPGGPSEVLLVRRHTDSKAFGGAHVFPGGRVDAADADPALLRAVPPGFGPAAARARLGEDRSPEAALAIWIGAIREVFEEAGILLAGPLGTDAAARARHAAWRAALLEGRRTFVDLVAAEHLVLTTDALVYHSRWITPETAPRRFDARFFVARLPEGQEPLHDDRETTSADWFTPARALADAQAGVITLTPPTVRTLEDLVDAGDAAHILAASRARIVRPITPRIGTAGGKPVVLYPGDADYAIASPGVDLGATPGPHDRLVMEGTGWRSERSG